MANATGPAYIRHSIVVDDRRIMHDGLIHIGIVNDGPVHVHHGGVIRELTTAPFATDKADAHVTEAIVDAAIVSDVRTPISGVEDIHTIVEAPVGRRPQCSLIWSRDPCTRNPVVAVIAISPVAWHPHQTWLRASWLHINRKDWRRKSHADENTRIRGNGDEGKRQRQNQPSR